MGKEVGVKGGKERMEETQDDKSKWAGCGGARL